MSRGGLYMMKYSLCHPEEFTHPHIAFFMGFIQFTNLWIAEFVNIAKGTQRKSPQDLITSYVGFKCIIEIPSIYLSGVTNVPVKAAIGKVTARRGRKDATDEKMHFHGLFNFIYVVNKWFFNSFYFYFYSFTVILLPLLQVLVSKAENN